MIREEESTKMTIEIPIYFDVWMDGWVENLPEDLYKTMLTIFKTLVGVS